MKVAKHCPYCGSDRTKADEGVAGRNLLTEAYKTRDDAWRERDAALAHRDRLAECLRNIEQHAYDDDTPQEDIMADFDEMRAQAREALLLIDGR